MPGLTFRSNNCKISGPELSAMSVPPLQIYSSQIFNGLKCGHVWKWKNKLSCQMSREGWDRHTVCMYKYTHAFAQISAVEANMLLRNDSQLKFWHFDCGLEMLHLLSSRVRFCWAVRFEIQFFSRVGEMSRFMLVESNYLSSPRLVQGSIGIVRKKVSLCSSVSEGFFFKRRRRSRKNIITTIKRKSLDAHNFFFSFFLYKKTQNALHTDTRARALSDLHYLFNYNFFEIYFLWCFRNWPLDSTIRLSDKVAAEARKI